MAAVPHVNIFGVFLVHFLTSEENLHLNLAVLESGMLFLVFSVIRQICINTLGGSGNALTRTARQEHWSGLPFPSPMYESEK